MENAELNNLKQEGSQESLNYIHDPDYYFHDGSMIILVGDVLFKVHTSHFAPHSSKEMFIASLSEDSMDCTGPGAITGLSNRDPVILPDVEPDQFRNFLYLFYGCPVDEKFRKVITGERVGTLSDTSKYYMDVAVVSYHLGMGNTQAWALHQLRPMMGSGKIAQYTQWTSSQLLQALHYSRLLDDFSLANSIRSVLGFHSLRRFSSRRDVLRLHASDVPDDPSDLLNVLYKNPGLRSQDRASFGQILCIILQAGSQSQIWAQALERSERATFFTLQVYLTPLPKCLDFTWLESPDHINKIGTRVVTCSARCTINFESVWALIFDNTAREQLKTNAPLGGVDALCNLILRRWEFLVGISSPDDPVFAENTVCEQCKTSLMRALDRNLDGVFSRLADLFAQVERDGYVDQASLNL